MVSYDTADATYCFWANSSEAGSNNGVFAHGGDYRGAFDINHGGIHKPLLYLASGHFQYWDDNPAQDDGKWHHWAVVVDIDSMAGSKLYIASVLQNQSTGNEGTALPYSDLSIGRSSSVSEYNGYLCNFGVWTGHLTQPQIKSIMWKNYAGLINSDKTNLVSWWNLDSTMTGSDGSFVRDNHYGGTSSELGSEVYTTNNALATVNYESDLPVDIITTGNTSDGLTLNGCSLMANLSTLKVGIYSALVMTMAAQNDRLSTSFSTTSGKSYEISFYMKFSDGIYTTAVSGVQETYQFKVGTSDNNSTNANVALLDIHTLDETTTDWYNYKVRFTATASTSHFTFIKTDAIGYARSAFKYIDEFSVKEFQGDPGELKF